LSRLLRLIIATSLTLLLFVVACIGITWALLASEAGLRFVTGQVNARAGGIVQWSQLQGSLLGSLQLNGLRVSLPGVALSADTLNLSWQPAALLEGTARMDTLQASGIRLTLTPTESDPDASPFAPGDLSLPVGLELGDISFTDLQIIQDGQAPVQIESLALSAQLENDQLNLRQLTARLPQGGISLSAKTALAASMPLNLEVTWDWLLAVPDDNADAASSGGRVAQLRGNLSLEGNIQWRDLIDFELRYRLETDGIQAFNSDLPAQLTASGELTGTQGGDELLLRRASLALADTPLSLSLTGGITALSAPEPQATVTLDWRELHWPLQAHEADIASKDGSVDFKGSASDYRLVLTAALAGPEIPDSHWTMTGSGNASGLTVERLIGQVLGGELAVSGELQWEPVPRWNLQLGGKALDPGQWRPELPGRLALALATTGEIHPDAGLQTDVVLRELSGQLLNFPLQGDARVTVAGASVQIVSLNLDSAGNELSANGEVSADALAFEWQLDADNPGSLIAEAAGELSARGRVSGSPEAPRLQAQASGSQLTWETYVVPSLTMSLFAGPGADDPLKLELKADQLLDGETALITSMQVQATGTTAEHRLSSIVATGSEQLKIRLDGGLNQVLSAWQGQLSRLSLNAGEYGQWTLVTPVDLSLAEDRASLGDGCLQAMGGTGRLCVRGQWIANGDAGMQGRVQALPLELFMPAVTGDIVGDLSATLAAGGALRVDSTITLSGGDVRLEDNRQLTHGGGKLGLQVNEKGLRAELELSAPEQGRLQAHANLPALHSLPMANEQPLEGSINAVLPDLSGLAAWVPEMGSSAGRLAADVQLAGSLSDPRIEGTLALERGAATLPLAGLELEHIELQVISDRKQPDRLAVSGGLRSGPGRLDLSGRIDLANSEFELALSGDRFQVFDTPDARALLTPDLHIAWREDTLNLRGQLTIPEAAITPKIRLSPAALGQGSAQEEIPGQVIGPSPDVVVVSTALEYQADAQLPKAPFRIDSNIRVLMGEHVRVSAAGFVSQITGSVDFINTPEQEDLIPLANGRFSLQDGTFRAFGQDLEIESGHLIFANVPATRPELNLRAVRWIDSDPQVTAAGVVVTGTLNQPSLELFSRPQLEASEIQSYLLTGSSPRSKNNVLGIGTYVSPRIYVGYGYNMLERTSEFNSLFNISPRYGVGSSVGEADNNINMTITYEH